MSRVPFEIKPLYTVPEIAAWLRWSKQRVRRLLATNAVPLVHSGRHVYVPKTVLERKLPDLWESLVDLAVVGDAF
jgi:excisionase family DNA binding protein